MVSVPLGRWEGRWGGFARSTLDSGEKPCCGRNQRVWVCSCHQVLRSGGGLAVKRGLPPFRGCLNSPLPLRFAPWHGGPLASLLGRAWRRGRALGRAMEGPPLLCFWISWSSSSLADGWGRGPVPSPAPSLPSGASAFWEGADRGSWLPGRPGSLTGLGLKAFGWNNDECPLQSPQADRCCPHASPSVFPGFSWAWGNGSPLQCSCLEDPRDGGAWGLPSVGSQSRTRLKRLSPSSSSGGPA